MDCQKAELADCDVNTTFVDTVTAPDLTHTIANLKNYTEYNIEIELFNGQAAGPKSPVIVIYTDEDSTFSSIEYNSSISLRLKYQEILMEKFFEIYKFTER